MKKNIGLTMRVSIADTGEIRDELDANWCNYIEDMGFNPIYLPHKMQTKNIIKKFNLDGFILTGGNDLIEGSPSYYNPRNEFEYKILDEAKINNIPVLGICRGMQVMNIYLGGKITIVRGHINKDHYVTFNNKRISVNSYHKYGINNDALAKDLNVLAKAEDDTIEAVKHSNYPWTALMWHPERHITNTELHAKIVKDALLGAK